MLRFVRIIAAAAAFAMFAPATLPAQTGNARIKATIGDESGQPVSQAIVVYHRVITGSRDANGRFQITPGQPLVNAQGATDATGAIATPQLPTGNYLLCVKATGYLTSCNWSGWHCTTISGGMDSNLGKIVLQKAAPVVIRFNDPQHLLASNALGMVVGVLDEANNFHAPEQSAADAGGRTLQVAVPYGRTMRLWVQAPKYRLSSPDISIQDSSDIKTPFHATPGLSMQPFTFNLVGTK